MRRSPERVNRSGDSFAYPSFASSSLGAAAGIAINAAIRAVRLSPGLEIMTEVSLFLFLRLFSAGITGVTSQQVTPLLTNRIRKIFYVYVKIYFSVTSESETTPCTPVMKTRRIPATFRFFTVAGISNLPLNCRRDSELGR